MADKTGIQWTDATWNPFVGCSILSPGCINCYAMGEAARQIRCAKGAGRDTHYEGTVEYAKGNPVWTGVVKLSPERILHKPFHWRAPRRVFVNSMSDLFHEDAKSEWIETVFAIMSLLPRHTFQILTKRAERMAFLTTSEEFQHRVEARILEMVEMFYWSADPVPDWPWPPPNVWLGVSAERQQEADERIPHLLRAAAAVRFVSAEPLLEAIDFAPKADGVYQQLSQWYGPAGFDPTGSQPRRDRVRGYFPRIDWVIVGGESGRDARELDVRWIERIVEDCRAAGVACFVKQLGDKAVKTCGDDAFKIGLGLKAGGGDMAKWPAGLRVRQFPEARA